MLPLVLAVLISSEPASAPSSDNEMIRSFCLVAFNAAMEQAGQIPPKGMGDFTCSCFLDRLAGGVGIAQSRAQCTEEAARRFPV